MYSKRPVQFNAAPGPEQRQRNLNRHAVLCEKDGGEEDAVRLREVSCHATQ